MLIAVDDIISLINANKTQAALDACESWLTEENDNPKPWQLLGMLHAKDGNFVVAKQKFAQALKIEPNCPVSHNNIANCYLRLHDIEQSIKHYKLAIQINPNYSEAWGNIGSLNYRCGELDLAVQYLEKAIRINPGNIEAHLNLALSFSRQDKLLPAISHYVEVLKSCPHHLVANNNLGMAYFATKQYELSVKHLEFSHDKEPWNQDIWYQLAHSYLHIGNLAKAGKYFSLLAEKHPLDEAINHNLAVIHLRNKDKLQARIYFNKAMKINPDNQTARYMLSALDSKKVKEANPKYVRDLFDQYADFYDTHMCKVLDYKVPAMLRQLIAESISSHQSTLNTLDLGCGTGLAGIYFRDLAKFLVGVDISSKMIEKAKQLGAYDSLVVANIQKYIPGETKEYFDLIIAADVFVYIGDLSSILHLASKALKQGGKLVFNIEKLEDGDYYLQDNGRFSHTKEYLQQVLVQHSFKIEKVREHTVQRVKKMLTSIACILISKIK